MKRRIVSLLNPYMCLTCRFAASETVETMAGPRCLLACRREMCDNHATIETPGPHEILTENVPTAPEAETPND